MLKKFLIALTAVVLSASGVCAMAQDARYLAGNCANCHGTNGKAEQGMPTLAGMSAAALSAAMTEFKAGTRKGTIMPQIAKGYSDEQISALAAYFSQQKP